jgi:signal transduction histidine kinase
MSRALALAFCCLVAAPLWTTPLSAQERGTAAEAKALAEKAAAHLHQVGPQQAIADFDDPAGGYRDRDLFVVVYDPRHIVVSAAGNPAFVGRDATLFKDTDGKEFGKAIIAAGETQDGRGWVEYRMNSPISHKVEQKASYVIKVDGYIVLVGIYKP